MRISFYFTYGFHGIREQSKYAVEAQTLLAPLSWFHGSRVTTAHAHQCCIFQSYAKTTVANEIDYEIDYAWASIHDNGHVITACDVWLQQRIVRSSCVFCSLTNTDKNPFLCHLYRSNLTHYLLHFSFSFHHRPPDQAPSRRHSRRWRQQHLALAASDKQTGWLVLKIMYRLQM